MSDCKEPLKGGIKLRHPRYDQNTYIGRLKHFWYLTYPTNVLATLKQIEEAKNIVEKYEKNEKLCITEDQLWNYRYLMEGAYHPDTGEIVPPYGRMCSQCISNVIILGGMLTFYKSTSGIVFWQWINQSYNAACNYFNSSGNEGLSNNELLVSYFAATTGAVVAALGFTKLAAKSKPILKRFCPFAAIIVANFINMPMMRHHELQAGTPIFDSNGKIVAHSVNAAVEGILKTIVGRVGLAAGPMIFTPFIMDHLERRGTICRYPWSNLPLQMLFTGLALVVSVPMALALFNQDASIPTERLEDPLNKQFKKGEVFTFNKGL